MSSINLPIIGKMHAPYHEKFGIPRQPNLVNVRSYIEMYAPYNDLLAFEGIEQFSHLWLIWQFHDNKNNHKKSSTQHATSIQQDDHHHDNQSAIFRPQVRPPRLGGNKKIGVFATRSMYRPSPIGLSVVQFDSIEKVENRLRIYVKGSDLLDGTPILDIKPYLQYADAIFDAQSGYAQQQPNTKQVIWDSHALLQQQKMIENQVLSLEDIAHIEQILALDPRPAYQDNRERIYKMKFATVDIQFKVNDTVLNIVDLQVL